MPQGVGLLCCKAAVASAMFCVVLVTAAARHSSGPLWFFASDFSSAYTFLFTHLSKM